MKIQAPLVELQDVTIDRGRNKKVLSHIDWRINPGEHWVLMGPNGAGKTTLLEILMGYLWPQKGHVTVLGETFGRGYLSDLRKKIGYVAPWVFGHLKDYMTVEEAVASGREGVYYVPGKVSRKLGGEIRKRLAWVGLRGFESSLFGELSSGQQFKVVLARALIHDPKILILDEPFSWLDLGARAHLYQVLERLVQRKKTMTMILVTHHLEDIRPFFNKAILLKKGRIFQAGLVRHCIQKKRLAKVFDLPCNA